MLPFSLTAEKCHAKQKVQGTLFATNRPHQSVQKLNQNRFLTLLTLKMHQNCLVLCAETFLQENKRKWDLVWTGAFADTPFRMTRALSIALLGHSYLSRH